MNNENRKTVPVGDDKKSSKHYFKPESFDESESPSRFCAICGKYLTDDLHIRG